MEWISQLRLEKIVKVVLLFTGAWLAQVSSAHAGNRLDAFESMCESNGMRAIDNYQVKDGAVYINFNSDFWSKATKDDQIRICNSLANIGFLEDLHVYLALFYIDNGNTKVGEISHDMMGTG